MIFKNDILASFFDLPACLLNDATMAWNKFNERQRYNQSHKSNSKQIVLLKKEPHWKLNRNENYEPSSSHPGTVQRTGQTESTHVTFSCVSKNIITL